MRSYYIRDLDKVNLGFNLDLWKGFYVSVRPSELGFQLNVDVANGVFFNNEYLVDLACKWYDCIDRNLEEKAKNDDNGAGFIRKLKGLLMDLKSMLTSCYWHFFFKGKTVKTYLNFKKRVEDIGPVASTYKIVVDDGEMTIAEYFLKKKKIKLK
jgi:hypothetical protein